MANSARVTAMAAQLGRGPNNLVSEPFVLAPNINKEHSSSCQGALHRSASPRSVSPTEQRFQSIEGNLLLLSNNFEKLNEKFDRFEKLGNKLDRFLDDPHRSRKEAELPPISVEFSRTTTVTPPNPQNSYTNPQLQVGLPGVQSNFPQIGQYNSPSYPPMATYPPAPPPPAPDPYGYYLPPPLVLDYYEHPHQQYQHLQQQYPTSMQQYTNLSTSPGYHQPSQISPPQHYQFSPYLYDEISLRKEVHSGPNYEFSMFDEMQGIQTQFPFSETKSLSIKQGFRMKLQAIPNVVFKPSKRKVHNNLQTLHTLHDGRNSNVHKLKRNIFQSSGFAWPENEEKNSNTEFHKLRSPTPTTSATIATNQCSAAEETKAAESRLGAVETEIVNTSVEKPESIGRALGTVELERLEVVDSAVERSYEEAAAKMNKGSLKYAWVLDKLTAERDHGILHDDSVVLINNSTTGDFEDRISKDGQSREHALLAFTLGLKHMICCCNKMDATTPQYSKASKIVKELSSYSKKVDYNPDKVLVVMIFGFEGDDRIKRSSNLDWYKGLILPEALDMVIEPNRSTDKPLYLPLQEVYKIGSIGSVPTGRVETGIIKPGMVVTFGPSVLTTEVKSVEMHHEALFVDEIGFKVQQVAIFHTLFQVLDDGRLIMGPVLEELTITIWDPGSKVFLL